MAKLLLTIESNGRIFSPPVEEGVKIEWERTGSPGKLTFTTLKVTNGDMSFQEGDRVRFSYDDKLVFVGYVFKKKRSREHHIEVTCYDQIRYLKNKYTYVFENKSATQIVESLCKDFNLNTGVMDNTNYIIPAVAEENKAALDIVLDVLEETLLNTGNLFVFYDNCGELTISDCSNMTSTTVIMDTTAENFDYTSSIDDETYNNVVLYYKKDDQIQIYTASSSTTIKKWGLLRHFEEVKTQTNGESKAKALLNLYNKKTRELKVTGAFGDVTVRGGTLIPVKLNLGDVLANNYMLVEKVTHKFEDGHHTMDLTLQGYWNDGDYAVTSKTIGEIVEKSDSSSSGSTIPSDTTNTQHEDVVVEETTPATYKQTTLIISCVGNKRDAGNIKVVYTYNNKLKAKEYNAVTSDIMLDVDVNRPLYVYVYNRPFLGGDTFSIYDPSALINKGVKVSNFSKGGWRLADSRLDGPYKLSGHSLDASTLPSIFKLDDWVSLLATLKGDIDKKNQSSVMGKYEIKVTDNPVGFMVEWLSKYDGTSLGLYSYNNTRGH